MRHETDLYAIAVAQLSLRHKTHAVEVSSRKGDGSIYQLAQVRNPQPKCRINATGYTNDCWRRIEWGSLIELPNSTQPDYPIYLRSAVFRTGFNTIAWVRACEIWIGSDRRVGQVRSASLHAGLSADVLEPSINLFAFQRSCYCYC